MIGYMDVMLLKIKYPWVYTPVSQIWLDSSVLRQRLNKQHRTISWMDQTSDASETAFPEKSCKRKQESHTSLESLYAFSL